MRFRAPVAGVAVLALALAGCGTSGSRSAQGPDSITVDLASSPIGHAAAVGRRIDAHSAGEVSVIRASGTSAGGTTSAGATPATRSAPAALDITPLTPRADARLNGVSVWIPYWGLTDAVQDAIAHRNVVRVAHPFIYQLSGTSTVQDESGGDGAAVSQQLASAGMDVIPTVTETDGMGQFAAVLTSRRKEAAMLAALESIGEAPNNGGIDLDFENLAVGTDNLHQASEVQTGYPVLVGRLCQALHRTGRSCEVTVMAKNTPGIADGDGLDTFVYDYAALARVADRIQLMAYDDHTPGGAAGPIAPWPWVQSVLSYALTQIPADKIVLGIPAYGYDWAANGQASTLTAGGAEALAAQEHAQIDWDAADAEPYFSYDTRQTTTKLVTRLVDRRVAKLTAVTVDDQSRVKRTVSIEKVPRQVVVKMVHSTGHVVWFEDSTADADRAVLAADDHLAGVAIWAGGDESPGLWPMLARLG